MLHHKDSLSTGQQDKLSPATGYLLCCFFYLKCFSPRPLSSCFLPIIWSQLKWPPPQTCLTQMTPYLISSLNIPLAAVTELTDLTWSWLCFPHLGYKFIEYRNFVLFAIPLVLDYQMSNTLCLINIYRMNKWINEWYLNFSSSSPVTLSFTLQFYYLPLSFSCKIIKPVSSWTNKDKMHSWLGAFVPIFSLTRTPILCLSTYSSGITPPKHKSFPFLQNHSSQSSLITLSSIM